MTRNRIHEDFLTGLDGQVSKFRELRPVCECMAELLLGVFKKAVGEMGIMATVEARAKTISSFAGKIARKADKYIDPVSQFDDLCGVRVIVSHSHELALVSEFILKQFDIDFKNSEDAGDRLGVGEFGYRSIHYTISLETRQTPG